MKSWNRRVKLHCSSGVNTKNRATAATAFFVVCESSQGILFCLTWLSAFHVEEYTPEHNQEEGLQVAHK